MPLNALLFTKHPINISTFMEVIYIRIGSKDTKTGRSKDLSHSRSLLGINRDCKLLQSNAINAI